MSVFLPTAIAYGGETRLLSMDHATHSQLIQTLELHGRFRSDHDGTANGAIDSNATSLSTTYRSAHDRASSLRLEKGEQTTDWSNQRWQEHQAACDRRSSVVTQPVSLSLQNNCMTLSEQRLRWTVHYRLNSSWQTGDTTPIGFGCFSLAMALRPPLRHYIRRNRHIGVVCPDPRLRTHKRH